MITERLAKVKLLAMDIDGTLTDGKLLFIDGREIKQFSVYDGLGIRLAMNVGLDIAWVSGNSSAAVADRARMLEVKDLLQGVRLKSRAMAELIACKGLGPDQVAFMGDDLNDLPAFDVCGVRIAVANAAAEVKDRADYVTQRAGGDGAVREAIESILKARGEWDMALHKFLALLKDEDARGTTEGTVA